MTDDPPVDEPDASRWGLGDVAIGWLLALVAGALGFVAVVALSGVTPVLGGSGFAVGQVTGQGALGQQPEVTETLSDLALWWRTLAQAAVWLALLGASLFAVWRKGVESPVAELGIRMRAADVPVGVLVGAVAQLAVMPGVTWLVVTLSGGDDGTTEGVRAPSSGGSGGVIALVLLLGLLAPIAEEVFYRGLAQRALGRRVGPAWAVVGAALLFGLAHLQSVQFPAMVLVGAAFGWLALRADRLGPAITAHVTFNLLAIGLLVADGVV